MQLQGDAADNPDQRIADDIKMFVERTLDIGLGAVELDRHVRLLRHHPVGPVGRRRRCICSAVDFAIPGYLVWAALIYAIFGTALTQWIGAPLVNLDFEQQRCEADFRFNLVRVRENSEQIALLRRRARRARAAARTASAASSATGTPS